MTEAGFVIDGVKVGEGSSPYVIAELSANHNGSLERALKSITEAKKCGASAVKIQTYTADTITIDQDSPEFFIDGGLWDGYKLYDLYKAAETPFEWHADLFKHAKDSGITIFSTPFDSTAVDLLEDLNTPAYKIASFEIVDLPLIRYAASTGKPLIISTGMASEDEITEAVEVARQGGCSAIALLHCISAYPTPLNEANVRRVAALSEKFGVIVGLSDHTLGNSASCAATALGAAIIEKHFALDTAEEGPDSKFSINPDQLTALCRDVEEIWSALGTEAFERSEPELNSRKFRRSIYFVKDVPQGALLRPEDVRSIRPSLGLPPREYDKLLGKRLKKAAKRGTPTSRDYFY